MSAQKELLLTCPLCGRRGFTARGLRAHWCPAKPATGDHKKHSAPLTRHEWLEAMKDAQAEATAEVLR